MRGPCYDRVPVSIALALMLAAPFGTAFAQDSNKLAATFNERFPVEETSTPPPLEIPEVKKEIKKKIKKKIKKEHSVTTTRAAKVKRPRVVVVPRSFLNAGTNVRPGDRKFLDYFPADPYCVGCGQQYGRSRGLAQFTTAGSVLSSVS